MNIESGDLAELANALEIGENEEVDVGTGVKAKAKKKSKKKKVASKNTACGTGEFCFNADRAQLIRVGLHEVKGRTLLASIALPAGTLFFNEKAVATVSHSKELCLHCGMGITSPVNDPMLPSDLFCSIKCLTNVHSNGVRHKYLQLLSEHVEQIAAAHCCDKDLLHMVFRLLALSLFPDPSGGSAPAEALCQDADGVITATRKGVNTLEAHLEQQPAAWVAAVTAGIKATVEVLQSDSSLNSLLVAFTPTNNVSADDTIDPIHKLIDYALYLACIVNVNAYGIVDYQSASSHSMGFGLFPAVGLCVNHACLPNSYYSYNAATGCMEYRTLRNVSVGEELTVSYTDIFLDTPQRRAALHEKRFFLCQCSRCAGYDLAENTALFIHNALTQGDSSSSTKKKKNKQEEEATKAALSPFYVPACGAGFVDALLEDWADEPAASSKKTAKSKSKDVKAVGANEPSVSSGKVLGSASVGVEGSDLKNILADAMLAGLCCEACGATGVVVAAGIATGGEPAAGACIVCTSLVDPTAAHVSLERCRAQWRICQDTVQYAVPGAAGAALVEKFLQEADPEYAMYTSCTALHSSGSGITSGAGAGSEASTAQAVALERRRKLKCPVQLHAQHATISEAYLLLYDHLWVQYQHAEQSGAGSSAVTLLAKVLYCLRRVLRSRRALLLPTLHPEVGATQYLLASVLQTAVRHAGKNSIAVKELKKECSDLLSEVAASRTQAFGENHALTLRAEALLHQATT